MLKNRNYLANTVRVSKKWGNIYLTSIYGRDCRLMFSI